MFDSIFIASDVMMQGSENVFTDAKSVELKSKVLPLFSKKVFSSTSTFACRTDHLSDAIDVHRILNLFTSYGQNR